MAQLGNQLRNLKAWKLPTFTRFSTLCHLDFQLTAIVQILRRNTKSARCHLLDGGGCVIPIRAWLGACRIFPTLTRIGLCTDAIHGNGKRFVRFRAERAQGNCRRNQAFTQLRNAFHFFHRNRRAPITEVQQITQGYRWLSMHGICITLVDGEAASGHCSLQHMDKATIKRVLLSTPPQFVKAAYRQSERVCCSPCAFVQLQHVARNTGKPNTGNT